MSNEERDDPTLFDWMLSLDRRVVALETGFEAFKEDWRKWKEEQFFPFKDKVERWIDRLIGILLGGIGTVIFVQILLKLVS